MLLECFIKIMVLVRFVCSTLVVADDRFESGEWMVR